MQLLLDDRSTKQGVGREIFQGHKNYHAGADLRCIFSLPSSDNSYKGCFKEKCKLSASGSQEYITSMYITSSQLGLILVNQDEGIRLSV